MNTFDFDAEAVLFFRPLGKGRAYPLTARRFDRACDAILFAAEDLPPPVIKSCAIEVGDHRISGDEVFTFYQSPDFPLTRLN